MNIMINIIFLKLFSLLSFSFLILLSMTFPIKSFSFSQQNFEQLAIDQPAIAQLPSPDGKNKIGYIILSTNVINDNGGNKQPSDFTINIHDTSAFPSSLKAVPSPQVQIISVNEGKYSISVNNVSGYNISLENQCEGVVNYGEVRSCLIIADDDNISSTSKLPILPLSLSDLLLPDNREENEDIKAKIAAIPKPTDPSKVGFLLISTNVINDNGGNKQPSDFTINILGTPSFPSSFKAASSKMIQVVAVSEGQYSVSVDNSVAGYQTFLQFECQGQINPNEIKTCLIRLNDISSSPQCPAGQHFDLTTQTCVPDLPPPPQGCPAGQHFDQTTQTCVPDLPPSGGAFPVQGITWMYDSKQTLTSDISLPSGETHPTDKVLLSSGASGVNAHPIKNGWLEVQSGGGNGRVYWNYHEVPQFSQFDTAGFNTVMTGTFKLKPGIENLSIKDGNHGTDGWVLDGKLVFGGFGFSIHRTEVQSKVEYWHNDQGQEVASEYPNGITLQNDKEYKFFTTMRADRTNQEVVLNVWLDFGDGKGWVLVMKDRKWGMSGWDPGSVPNGDDKAEIENGSSSIKKHHIWTRANGSGDLPIKDIRIGTIGFIS
jgi:hypothetical protein